MFKYVAQLFTPPLFHISETMAMFQKTRIYDFKKSTTPLISEDCNG